MRASDDPTQQARDALNTRLTALFERGWPTISREMARMARGRWASLPRGAASSRRWELATTLRLLEAPAPSEIEQALGIAAAVAHVEASCPLRGAVEAWTLTLRSYADHDEAQIVGARTAISRDVSPAGLRRLLCDATLSGPGYYPLTTQASLTATNAARRDQHASEV